MVKRHVFYLRSLHHALVDLVIPRFLATNADFTETMNSHNTFSP